MTDRPAPSDHPVMAAEPGWVQPCPRRVRGHLGARTVLDTTRALYVWEHEFYPQWYLPVADLADGVLAPSDLVRDEAVGPVTVHDLQIGGERRPGAAWAPTADAPTALHGTVRLDWSALEQWYEEDEQVFVHPRNPYVRVDALRSHRHVRVELDGVVLAQSWSPVLLFETGLPTRYYLDRSEVSLEHLVASETVTQCPYKGRTSSYWSAAGDGPADIAWSYDFPTGAVLPVAGLVAFLNERVDLVVDGERLQRPVTRHG